MDRFRFKYTYEQRFGNLRHTWTMLGAKGAIHLHITDLGEAHKQRGGVRYSGGIEIHWRSPPEYMQDQPPSQDECWLLHCPCWHDGSSLQVEEFWIPQWLASLNDHDAMFALLESRMAGQFADTPEPATAQPAPVDVPGEET